MTYSGEICYFLRGIDFAHFWWGVLKCSDASVTNQLRELTLFAVSWVVLPW